MSERRDECIIGIDCPPGEPRPNVFLPRVLRGTGLRVSDFEAPNTLFGAWTWRLKPDPKKTAMFIAKRPVFMRRLAKLVENQRIRGVLVEPTDLHLISGI